MPCRSLRTDFIKATAHKKPLREGRCSRQGDASLSCYTAHKCLWLNSTKCLSTTGPAGSLLQLLHPWQPQEGQATLGTTKGELYQMLHSMRLLWTPVQTNQSRLSVGTLSRWTVCHLDSTVDTTCLYVLRCKELRKQYRLKQDTSCAPASIPCLSSQLALPVALLTGNSGSCFSYWKLNQE